MPALHTGGLHQVGEVFSGVQEAGEHAPEEAKRWSEARLRQLLLLYAVDAGGQLAAQGDDRRRGLGSGRHEGRDLEERVGGQLVDQLEELGEVPMHHLEGAHGYERPSLRRWPQPCRALDSGLDGVLRRDSQQDRGHEGSAAWDEGAYGSHGEPVRRRGGCSASEGRHPLGMGNPG